MKRLTLVLAGVAIGGLNWCAVAAHATDLIVDQNSKAATADGSAGAPFRTIGEALRAVKPGDAVVIKAGVYRESLSALPEGGPGKPFRLAAGAGERVVVTAAVPVTGWQKQADGVYTATIPAVPARVLLDNRELPVSRQPNDGWWAATDVGENTLIDPAHLKGLKVEPAKGSQVYVWVQKGNTFLTAPVARVDRAAGKVELEPAARPRALTAQDRYYLKNDPQFIDRPGEWAAVQADGKVTLYYLPTDPAELPRVEIIPSGVGNVFSLPKSANVVIDGLEIYGGKNGIELTGGAANVTIQNCVIHHNDYAGVRAHGSEAVTVRRSVVQWNEYGVMFGESKKALVEECDIGWNGTDGMIFSWNSDDVTLRRSYVHHHLLWGHPDNTQTYRNVTNLKFEDNLLLGSGQSLMSEQTDGGAFTGNMVVGSMANMFIFGHASAKNMTLSRNTLAFPGYQCVVMSAENYTFRENMFVVGRPNQAYSTKGVKGYAGDRNLFFGSERGAGARGRILQSDARYHTAVEDFAAVTGTDVNSKLADPKFRNAPIAFAVLDDKKIAQSTAERMFIRGGAGLFKQGDVVEFNFDGKPRRVTAIDAETITVSPALPEAPTKTWLVSIWGDNDKLALDLRPGDGSPALTLGEGGKPVGSSVDIQAYQRGDFDGDGKRDLPELPPGLGR
jgi:hypothetical protein